MKVKFLLIHQNFPGQFRQLAPYLHEKGHELVAICSHQRYLPAKFRLLRYQVPPKPPDGLPHSSQLAHEAFQRAALVARLCEQLKGEGWRPDLICAHPGWGETLAIREVWPEVFQILWPEVWLRPEHAGWGVDPEKPLPGLEQKLEHVARNSLTRASLDQARGWVLPTVHQARSFPHEFQNERMQIVHEGIDTKLACPNPEISFEVRGIKITKDVPVITFVNRNLERLRGFDTFMRSLPEVLSNNKKVRVLIVGDNEGGYGGGHSSGRILKDVMLEELSGKLDLERIHFLGRIPHSSLIALFQASSVHVYLSYPFILGWSLLEAMSCGCCIIGSEGMPVKEAITHDVEGLLVPIIDPLLLSKRILYLLETPLERQRFSEAARKKAMFWEQSYTLDKLYHFLMNIK